jgi:hypothetical protein
MTHVAPISDLRWLEAQQGERRWWQATDRAPLIREMASWYAGLLRITPDAVAGKTVIDLGGGPMPLAVLLGLPFGWLTVVDPLATLLRPDPLPNVARYAITAEDFNSGSAAEVWGYNVLQHVLDPAAVIAVAKRHTRDRVRWFDWVETPVVKHHPHSISADWLVEQFAGWEVSETRGFHAGHQQHYVALVAERPAT